MPVEVDPSRWLALDLDATTIDPRALSDAQVVEAMAGFGRVASWAQARPADHTGTQPAPPGQKAGLPRRGGRPDQHRRPDRR